jgi:Ser/Thr protein kinase RdoA (MazF antagonist)
VSRRRAAFHRPGIDHVTARAQADHRLLPTPAGYAGLSPQEVLDAMDAVGLRGDGRILQLNSFENRVFQVYLEDGSAVVAKFYRPGRWSDEQILEEHDFALELAGAEVEMVAPLLLQSTPPTTLAHTRLGNTEHRMSVSPCVAGRAPELEDPETLRWLGRFLGRTHSVGAVKPFMHRRRIQLAAEAESALKFLLEAQVVTPHERASWEATARSCIELMAGIERTTGAVPTLRLHGDCHPGNVMWRPQGPHVVDLDDACMGPAVQDLWMLISGDRTTQASGLSALLQGYRQFMRFDERELALIEPLRTLRMLRHSAWLAERASDPAVAQAFPWFGEAAYWSQQTMQLREQLTQMGEPPPQVFDDYEIVDFD